ncbi:MAG: DUF4860 domain-containing protein [Clostridiaceae bacterium]|nr:DUF4860 domain-containing protein [Clostridiaceae bacterium]
MNKNRSLLPFFSTLICILSVTMMGAAIIDAVSSGASAYESSSDAVCAQYTARTLVSYVSAKIQGTNAAGNIYISDFDGVSALFLEEEIEGEYYITAIYCQDGFLKELFAQKDSGLSPSDGMEIISCQSFVPLQISPELIHLSFESGGEKSSGYVSVLTVEDPQ